MTPGVHSVVSALNARWAQQTQIAENISGASTVGHKRQVSAFGAFDEVLQHANADAPGAKLTAPLAYALPVSTDWTSGPLLKTGAALDAAITGPGFFAVQTPTGVRLTRNGHFSLDKQRRLVNDAGSLVLGASGPIKLPRGKATLQPDGTVVVDGKAITRLQILMPNDLTQLRAEGNSYFSAPQTRPVKGATLFLGVLESSNVDLPKEMVGMIHNQRMYEMLTRAFQTQDEGLARAIQDLSNT